MAVELRALGRHWGVLTDDGRYLEVRRHDDRIARIDLVESVRVGRPVLVRINTVPLDAAGDACGDTTAGVE